MRLTETQARHLSQQATDPALPARHRLAAHYVLAAQSEAQLEAARAEALRQAEENPQDALPLMVAAALEATRAKFTLWPHKQLAHAQAGLRAMDEILERHGLQWPLLYVRAALALHLPFFFNRQEEAYQDICALAQLMASLPADANDPWRAYAARFVVEFGQKAGLTKAALSDAGLLAHLGKP